MLTQTILAVIPAGEDRTFLEHVFDSSQWKINATWTFEGARTLLRVSSPRVVISEGHLPGGYCWKDLLNEIQGIANPPPLIVTDRLADERMWAEVLNLGGYDLLMKPFNETEMLRVVIMACRFHANQLTRIPAPQKLPESTQDLWGAPKQRHAVSGRRR